MGDILIYLASRMLRVFGLWSCGDRRSDLHQIPRPAGLSAQRTRAEPAPLRMDVAQFDVGITHQPVTALGLANADRLADQCLTDKDQLARPFDLAVAAHAAHRNLVTIVRILEPVQIGPRRRLVPRSRRLLPQRLVWPVIVVDRTERVEPLLLRRQTGGRRCRRLLVERAVHPLVAPILLRLARHNPLRSDTQLDPPHRQPRQPTNTGRRKRRTVIRADRQRQAMLLEGRLEDRPHMLFVRSRHALTAQPAARAVDHTLTPQPLPDRAGRWHRQLRMVLSQLHPQLLGPPVRPTLAQSQHRLHHGNVMRLAVLQRRVRALRQTCGAFPDIPAEPLVAGLPADPVLTAQHAHLILARQNPSDKLYLLVHVTGRFPRHRQVPPASSSNLSPLHQVNSVTNLPGPYTLPSPASGGGLGWVSLSS